jgi:sensor histidine kinase YesM
VRDNGPGIVGSLQDGVGLGNTRARLAQLYGAAHSLTLSSHAEGGLTVEISLPFHTSDDLRTAGVPPRS